MKKLLIAAIIMMGFTVSSLAQTSPATKKEPAKTKPAHVKSQKVMVDTVIAVKPATVKKPGSDKLVKKDGTPDMRYKANKDSVKTAKVLKKDGTPDKRFKANKKTS